MSVRSGLAVSLFVAIIAHQEPTAEALTRGGSLKWRMRSQEPFRREALRMGAVRSFRAGVGGVGTRNQRALCAFRAGELLRAGGLHEAALREFTGGARFGSSPWSHRSALEGGKILMVVGRHAEAICLLQTVSGDEVPSRFAESAAVQRGVALAAMGRRDSAAEVLRAVAEDGVTPRARLDAFERWGRQLLNGGDLEGAAGVLHLCRVKLTRVSLEATEQGRELRTLLESSPLATAIRREVHRRHETGE